MINNQKNDKNIGFKKIVRLMVLFILSTDTAFGCMTTIFNDSKESIKIVDQTDKNNQQPVQVPRNILFVPRNKSIRFGKPHEHAHFTVFVKVPNSHTFTATYEVKQIECGTQGSPYLRMSDIQNNTGDASLYTITRLEPSYSSMVHELTSLKRPDIFYQEQSSCSSCSH